MKLRVRYILLLVLIVLPSVPASAQIKNLQFSDRMESARKLYYNGSYYAAEKAFTELSNEIKDEWSQEKSEAEAFKVLCAIASDKVNVDGLVKNFCLNYPNAPQQNMLKHSLASRYFERGDYKSALSLIEGIKESYIERASRTDFIFKKAYCNMRAGKQDVAIELYRKILNGRYSQYTVPSTYYLGFVYYRQKNFAEASPLFEECFNDSRFSLMSRYYALECRFLQKDYSYVIANGATLMPELERDLQSNLARILSEAYYADGQPGMAQKYLDVFKQSGTALSRKDHYFSGILSYSLNSYQEALDSFERVIGVDDDLSQNAYYYGANSYLQIRNKIKAMEYFLEASQADYDPVIKEDAMFNHAKLCFDVNKDISKFNKYMEVYPNSGKDDIINNYMAASFLLSKDYRSATEVLRQIRRPTRESSANLQKASFFRAMQLVENRGYRSAIPLLEISIANGASNEDLCNLAKYWLSECYYRNDRYDEAKALNEELLSSESFRYSSEYINTVYNQAYCYFKSGDFENAEKYFNDYINSTTRRRSFERDARIRLADSYYMRGNYKESSQLYEDIYRNDYMSDDVYPAYQAAVSYGLTGDEAKKISILRQVTHDNKTSPYYPQSLYELGRTYVQTGKDEEASACFYTLLALKGDSTFYAKSLLELAMVNSNNKRYDRAIEYYKTIIEECPSSLEVQDALSGMESVYQTQNRPEDFLAYIDEIGMSSLKSADEKETMLFESAEQLFLTGKYTAAQSALQRFIRSYPNGVKTMNAVFYLAECQREQGRFEIASDNYMKVMKGGDESLLEAATAQYAKISYDLQHYDKAISAYDMLSSVAKTDEMRLGAYLGRMRSCFNNKLYANVVKDAQRIISTPGRTKAMEREAKYMMAKSYVTLGDRDLAKPMFAELAEDSGDRFGAECAYVLIQEAYDKGDFPDVEKRVYAFADKGSDQVYWLARSFIVLGDSFADREDFAQAKATFESILEGYDKTDDDVQDQVRSRLNMLKNMGE